MATGVLVARRRPRHPAARPPDAHATRRTTPRCASACPTATDDAEGEVVVDRRDSGALGRATVRGRARGRSWARSLQVPTAVSAIKVDGKRAYAAGPRRASRSSSQPRPVDGATSSSSTTSVPRSAEVGRRRPVAALLERHLRARDRARRRRPRSGSAAHLTALRRTAVGPSRPRRALAPSTSSPTDSTVARRSPTPRGRAFPARRPRRRGRRSTSGSAVPLDARTSTGLTAVFAPDGEFLALYEPRDGVARAGRSRSS